MPHAPPNPSDIRNLPRYAEITRAMNKTAMIHNGVFHGPAKKASRYRKQTRHGNEHLNTQNSSKSTFAQKIVETFHRKARTRFETSFDTKLAQPPQLPTVGNWIRCIAKVKTSEKKH